MSSTHRHLLLDFFWQVISGPPCILLYRKIRIWLSPKLLNSHGRKKSKLSRLRNRRGPTHHRTWQISCTVPKRESDHATDSPNHRCPRTMNSESNTLLVQIYLIFGLQACCEKFVLSNRSSTSYRNVSYINRGLQIRRQLLTTLLLVTTNYCNCFDQ
jgi:hypothetical protein